MTELTASALALARVRDIRIALDETNTTLNSDQLGVQIARALATYVTPGADLLVMWSNLEQAAGNTYSWGPELSIWGLIHSLCDRADKSLGINTIE